MALGGLLDQQHSALLIGDETRSAAAQRTLPLAQEAVGSGIRVTPFATPQGGQFAISGVTGDASLLLVDPFAGSGSFVVQAATPRFGSIFLEAENSSEFFWHRDRDALLTSGSARWPVSYRDVMGAINRSPVTQAMQQRDFVSHVTAIRDLVRREQIGAARRLLDLLPASAMKERAVARLRRALTPPTVRPSGRKDHDHRRAYQWLRQHGREYQGQWVAVTEAGIVAAAPTLKQLRAQLRDLAPGEQPLIHKL